MRAVLSRVLLSSRITARVIPRIALFSSSSSAPEVDLSGVNADAAESVVVEVGGGKQVMGAANIYNMKYAPKKLKERIRLVRGLSCQEAIRQLRLTYKMKDRIIAQVVQNAVANAVHNHNLNKERLVIKEIWLGKAPTLKRLWWCGRGKMSVIQKRRSHLYVRVAEQPVGQNDKKIGKFGRRVAKQNVTAKVERARKSNRKFKSPIS